MNPDNVTAMTKAGDLSDANAGSGGSSVERKRTVTFDDNDRTTSSPSSETLRGGMGGPSILKGASYGAYEPYGTYEDSRGFTFNNKEVRMGFVRKVYSILFLQLALTTGSIACFLFIDSVRQFALRHIEILYIALAVYIVTMLILYCCPGCRRQHPTNMILLFIFTVALAYMVGLISVTYKTESVLLAFGICAVCCFAITIFAFVTPIDFTKFGIYLYIALWCLILFGIILMFVKAPIAHKIYASLGALLFMMYLLYDTQQLIGGKSVEISPDEYVHGALVLYVDIIQIFLFLLQLFGERR